MMKQTEYMVRHGALPLIILTYLAVLLIKTPGIFSYRFNPALIPRYLCSQDIPAEPPCKRLFLSDSDIHIAAGYLYAKGADPTTVNFQHPPLLKYLFGFSIMIFNNPFIAQIGLGIAFLILSYVLGVKLYENTFVSFIAGILLVADPLFHSLSSQILLDLGQGVFLLLYILLFVFYPKKYLLQGIALGLLSGSKFWGGSIYFILAVLVFRIFKRQFDLKEYTLHIVTAGIIFCCIYFQTFLQHSGLFNIVFFELKTVKYWFQHSTSSIFGSSAFLFLTGFVKSWWGNRSVVRETVWSPMWPVLFIITCIRSIASLKMKKNSFEILFSAIPVLYLIYLGFQAPFARYFILVLPFFYLISTRALLHRFFPHFKK